MAKKITHINRMKGSPSTKMNTLGNLKVPEARMNTPCTVAEATQIALAAAEDIVQAYTGEMNKLVIQQTLFIDGLKRTLINKEIVTADEFSDILKTVAEEYQKERDAYIDKKLNHRDEEEVPVPTVQVVEDTKEDKPDETEDI